MCAIVIALGLIPFASAQTAKPAELAPTRLVATSSNLQALRAAKARPAATRLRASFSANIAATRVNLAEIDRSSVPVLVSARPSLVANLRVFARPDRYTASTTQNGAVIEINGTRLPRAAPKSFRLPKTTRTMQLEQSRSPDDMLRDVRVDHTGSGVDVTFTRFGSVYNLTIDCGETGQSDPEAIGPAPGTAQPASGQCTDDNALAIAREMEVLGGGEPAQ